MQEGTHLVALEGSGDALEIRPVLLVLVRDVKGRKPPLVRAGWHDPILVRGDHDVEHVAYHHHVPVLGLDGEGIFGDDPLELPLPCLVASPEGLIGKEGDTVPEMGVEPPRHQAGRGDMDPVLAKGADDGTAQNALACPPPAPEHDRRLGLLVRILIHPGQPADDVVPMGLIPSGKDMVDMVVDRRPLALLRLNGKAAPEIEGSWMVLACGVKDEPIPVGWAVTGFEPGPRLAALMMKQQEIGLRSANPRSCA